jgi:hypothetical protein
MTALIGWLALGVGVQPAGAMTIGFNSGTIQDTTSIVDTMTSIDLVGVLQVSATFADGSSQSLTWGAIPDPCGGACPGYRGVIGTGWKMMGSGNTFAMQWQYFQTGAPAITSLNLTGTNIAFDQATPGPGTPGSSGGIGFIVDTNNDGFADNPANWSVNQSNAVTLNGAAPVGDLYTNLNINFGSGGYTGNFYFLLDSDTYVPAAVTPPDNGGGGGTTVPEPSSIMLLGMGVLSLVARRQRIA